MHDTGMEISSAEHACYIYRAAGMEISSAEHACYIYRPSVYSFMPQAWKFPQQSTLATFTGPISVANYGLIFVFDIRH
jgi:hypothetical protein